MPYIVEYNANGVAYLIKDAEGRKIAAEGMAEGRKIEENIDESTGFQIIDKDALDMSNRVYYAGQQSEVSSTTVSMDDIMLADQPIIVNTDDDYRFCILYYNGPTEESGVAGSAWFSDAESRRKYSIAEGNYYRLQFRRSDGEDITIEEARRCFVIYKAINKNAMWYGTRWIANREKYNKIMDTASACTNLAIQHAAKNTKIKNVGGSGYVFHVTRYTGLKGEVIDVAANIADQTEIQAGTFYAITIKSNDGTRKPVAELMGAVSVIENEEDTLRDVIRAVKKDTALLKERVREVENDGVPSYYTEHLAGKLATINGYSGVTDESVPFVENTTVDQFVFITDYHGNAYAQTGHSKAMMTYLVKNSAIDKVINGGDSCNGGTSPRKLTNAQYKHMLAKYISDTVPDAPCDFFYVIGNHDRGKDYDGQGGEFDNLISTEELKEFAYLCYSAEKQVVDPKSGNTAYYFDVPDKKIRYIISNHAMRDYTYPEGYGDAWKFIMQSMLSVPDDYVIVFISHRILNNINDVFENTAAKAWADTFDAYNRRGVATYSSVSIDCANAKGKVVIWIAGHTHKDLVRYSDGGIPCVMTTTDNCGGEAASGLTRTPGTVTEQAFDVVTIDTENKTIHMTRIGAGSDREYTWT